MSMTDKKSTLADAMAEIDLIQEAIKKQSKDTISGLLAEEVKQYMREEIEKDEPEYEVQDDEKAQAENEEGNDKTTEEPEEEVADDATDTEDTEDVAQEVSDDVEGEDGEEGSEFDAFKVDDDTYDLTGAKDDDVVKVFKRLDADDNILVRKEDNQITIKDNENGTEYVIELGDDDEDDILVDNDLEESASQIAGLPNNLEEKRKTMKNENKEMVYEIDLGYTDEYQKDDAIEGLSMTDDTDMVDVKDGIPTGTERPYGNEPEKEGDPFVNEEEEVAPEVEEPVEEGTNVTMPNVRKKVKSHSPEQKENPVVAHHDSKAGEYKAMAESLIKKAEAVLEENKQLKETVNKVKLALQEAMMVNVNLGKITKLFTENSTTQNEKKDIVNRFNNVKTIAESNALYESISRELKANKQPATLQEPSMVVESKINEEPIYESQELNSIKDFMNRMSKC